MPEPDETPVVTGRRATPIRRELSLRFAATIGLVVLFVVLRQWVYLTATLVFVAVTTFRIVQPATVIDRNGIRRPWSRVSFLSWDQIDHVVQPRYATHVQVRTTDSRTINLTDVDVSRTADVAATGHKSVTAEAFDVPKPVARERTQREIEADVTRRVAELAVERDQLARNNIRWPRT